MPPRKKNKKMPESEIQSAEEELRGAGFDRTFKFYKQRCPPPDCSLVFDLAVPQTLQKFNVDQSSFIVDPVESKELGIQTERPLAIHKFGDKEGLLFIKNPFTVEGQQFWTRKCLQEYTRSPPHRLNVDVHPEWRVGGDRSQWWEACCKNDEFGRMVRKKLRWSTLGYHHNWDSKVYSEVDKSEFPQELARLSQFFAKAAGFQDFTAEAAIVNFYHMDSTLAGHTDHSEDNHTAPLISIRPGTDLEALILISCARFMMAEGCCYGDLEVVREVYDSENAHDDFEKQLDRLLEAGVPIIVIEPGRLGDETARWLSVGRCLHNTSIISGIGALIAGFVWSDRPLFCCPFGTLSIMSAGLYTLSWHFDPCCKYQVVRSPKVLSDIARKYPRVNAVPSTVLTRNDASHTERHVVHWTVSLAASALCLYRLYSAFK